MKPFIPFFLILGILILFSTASGAETPTGSLGITSFPNGANVYLDNKFIGKTDITIPKVVTGYHEIRLQLDGYRDAEKIFFVEPNEKNLFSHEFILKIGSISVSSTPPGANVYLDELYRGKTPIMLYSIKEGAHTLSLSSPEYQTWSTTLSLKDGDRQDISHTFVPSNGKIISKVTYTEQNSNPSFRIVSAPAIQASTRTIQSQTNSSNSENKISFPILWTYKTNSSIRSISVSRDGSYVAAVTSDGWLHYINNKGVREWFFASDRIKTADIMFDGSLVIAGSSRNLYYLDGDKNNPNFNYNRDDFYYSRDELSTHFNTKTITDSLPFNAVAISPDGKYILAGTGDSINSENKLFLMEWYAGNNVAYPTWNSPETQEISDIDISHDGTAFAVGEFPGMIGYFTKGKRSWTHPLSMFYYPTVALSTDGKYIVGGSDKIYFLDDTGSILWSYPTGKSDNRVNVAISGDGSYILGGSDKLYLLNKKGELIGSKDFGYPISAVAMSKDASTIVVGADKLYTLSTTLSSFTSGSNNLPNNNNQNLNPNVGQINYPAIPNEFLLSLIFILLVVGYSGWKFWKKSPNPQQQNPKGNPLISIINNVTKWLLDIFSGTTVIPPDPKNLVDKLIKVLRTGKPLDQGAAACKLAEIGKDSINPLVQLLKDTNPDVRKFAALALGRTGSTEVRESLKDSLNDSDEDVRFWAQNALNHLN